MPAVRAAAAAVSIAITQLVGDMSADRDRSNAIHQLVRRDGRKGKEKALGVTVSPREKEREIADSLSDCSHIAHKLPKILFRERKMAEKYAANCKLRIVN